MLATTSDKGTVIRLWNPMTGASLHELRRGSNPATIQHLSFECEVAKYLSVCSDKDTVHVFRTETIGIKEGEAAKTGNLTSWFSYAASLVPVAGSEWSFA